MLAAGEIEIIQSLLEKGSNSNEPTRCEVIGRLFTCPLSIEAAARFSPRSWVSHHSHPYFKHCEFFRCCFSLALECVFYIEKGKYFICIMFVHVFSIAGWLCLYLYCWLDLPFYSF